MTVSHRSRVTPPVFAGSAVGCVLTSGFCRLWSAARRCTERLGTGQTCSIRLMIGSTSSQSQCVPPGPQIYIPAWVFCMSRYVDFEFRGSAVRRLRWSENFPSGDGTKPSCMRSVARTQQEMLRFDVQYMRARFAALCRLPRPSPQLFCSADALPGSAPLSLFPKLPAACTHSRDGLRNEPLPNARDAGIHVSNIDYLRHNWA